MKKLFFFILIFFVTTTIHAQDWVTDNNFDKVISGQSGFGDSEDIIVIEFWAEFNDKNKWMELSNIKQCGVYRTCIVANKDLADKYNVKVLPTIIVFNNREEVCRWEGNLMFELNLNKKEVQTIIDSIIIDKYR